MDRKEFLRQSVKLGGCCGLSILAASLPGVAEDKPAQDKPAEPAKPDGKFHSCEERVDQGQHVIRRIIGQLDSKLDQKTREEIMENCGRECHNAYRKDWDRKHTPEEIAGFLKYMKEHFQFEEAGDETIVYFKYTQNPRGLKTTDGYCLCPIFEVPPKDLSPTFCHCSVGYVTEIFRQNLGRPVKVTLGDSVLRNGKQCSFTVRFQTA